MIGLLLIMTPLVSVHNSLLSEIWKPVDASNDPLQ
jgi:hypothetical protein